MSNNIILYYAVFHQIYVEFCFDSYTFMYILIIQFWHYNVRLSYRFSASFFWMLTSLLSYKFTEFMDIWKYEYKRMDDNDVHP